MCVGVDFGKKILFLFCLLSPGVLFSFLFLFRFSSACVKSVGCGSVLVFF